MPSPSKLSQRRHWELPSKVHSPCTKLQISSHFSSQGSSYSMAEASLSLLLPHPLAFASTVQGCTQTL